MTSKFVKNSVNFSETNLLKKSILLPILQAYNEIILKSNSIAIHESNSFFIPNNNKKYYLLITNKINMKYKTLYFFPNNYEPINILEKNTVSDFYIEIDSNTLIDFKQSNYLFEGYYYNQSNFLVTDILSIDSKIIDCDYSLRYSLINNLFNKTKLQNLNGHLSIGIHSIFDYNENYKDILSVFKHNFIFKNEINSIEIIKENNLEKIKCYNPNNKENANKIITKTKYIDVYNVYNIETNNKEGILYVKTLNDSKLLHELLNNLESINIKCKFNIHFNKWAPLF